MPVPWKKSYDNLSIFKSRDMTLLTKVHIVKVVFPSSHIQVWELKHKEDRMPKNWSFWTVVLEKTLQSPLDNKEIKPLNHEGNQPWMFIGRTNAEPEAPILWPPDIKVNSLEKTLMLGKIESRRKMGWQRMRWLDSIIDSRDMSMNKPQETVKDRKAWYAAVHGVTNSQTQISKWT